MIYHIYVDDYKLAKFYSEKVEPITLLGNGDKRFIEVDKEIEDLKKENTELKEKVYDTDKKITELTNVVKGLNSFLMNEWRRLNEDYEFYKDRNAVNKDDYKELADNFEKLNNLMKQIDNLDKK